MQRLWKSLAALALVLGTAAPAHAEAAPAMSSKADSLIYLNGLNHLFVVDPITFQTVQDVPMKGLAQLVVPSDDLKTLYVVDGQRERIEVIERESGKNLETLSFTQPGRTKARVYAMAVVGDRLYAYLNTTRFDGYEPGKLDRFHLAEPELVVLDLKSKKKVGRMPMPLGILFLQPGPAGHMYAIGRDIFDVDLRTMTKKVHVALGDPATEGEGSIIMYAEWVHPECSHDVAGYTYWTTDPITNRTFVGLGFMKTTTGRFDHFDLCPPIAGQYPQSAMITPDGKKAYMMMNRLMEVDLAKRRVTRVHDYGNTFYAVNQAPDGSAIYLSSAGTSLVEVDPATLEQRRRIELPAEVFDISIMPAAGGPKKQAAK